MVFRGGGEEKGKGRSCGCDGWRNNWWNEKSSSGSQPHSHVLSLSILILSLIISYALQIALWHVQHMYWFISLGRCKKKTCSSFNFKICIFKNKQTNIYFFYWNLYIYIYIWHVTFVKICFFFQKANILKN